MKRKTPTNNGKQSKKASKKRRVRRLPLSQIAKRLYDAFDARKNGGLVAEVARWRNDERYQFVQLMAASILGQNSLSKKSPA
ncbi:MAG: hypothetical protein AAB534_03640 [Patescibacteria group bacterium]